MKCPKCGYLGFDHVDRCRNCGYDFSLAPDAAVPELPLRSDTDVDGFADLSLVAPRKERELPAELDSDFDRVLSASAAPEPRSPARAPAAPARVPAAPANTVVPEPAPLPEPPAPPAEELPLFGGPITDDVPLITKASPPRPPLSVRRATPEVPRLRGEPLRTPTAELRLDLQSPEPLVPNAGPAARGAAHDWKRERDDEAEDASVGSRLLAAAIDLVVLGIVDAIVVYFTLQICGLTATEFDVLPKVPLLAFLAVQNGGYLVAFTAGGQTLGKMAAGIKVVAAGSGSSLEVGRAALRTLMWVVLAIPAGLGFLTVFAGDRRGLHDRFAGTRVVRASA